MEIFADTWQWFTDGANWSGTGGIPSRVWEHVQVSLVSVALALAIALPAGLVIGHTRRGEFLAVTVANLGRAIPSFAIIALIFPLFLTWFGKAGFGFLPTLVAMVLLGIPPILTNTYVGVQNVDPDTVEAARGMGLSGREVLMQLELPLAIPLVVAGVRTAAVQVIATATLAALIGGGGLGRYIIDGFAQQDTPMIMAGAILVALLAIVAELGFGALERALSPRTSSAGKRLRDLDALPPGTPSRQAASGDIPGN